QQNNLRLTKACRAKITRHNNRGRAREDFADSKTHCNNTEIFQECADSGLNIGVFLSRKSAQPMPVIHPDCRPGNIMQNLTRNTLPCRAFPSEQLSKLLKSAFMLVPPDDRWYSRMSPQSIQHRKTLSPP